MIHRLIISVIVNHHQLQLRIPEIRPQQRRRLVLPTSCGRQKSVCAVGAARRCSGWTPAAVGARKQQRNFAAGRLISLDDAR